MDILQRSVQDHGSYLHVLREQAPDAHEVLATLEHVAREHPDRKPLLYEYRCEGCSLSADDAPALIERGRALIPFIASRVAVLTCTKEQFGMMRLLGAHAHRYGLELRPFHGQEQALAWLHERGGAY